MPAGGDEKGIPESDLFTCGNGRHDRHPLLLLLLHLVVVLLGRRLLIAGPQHLAELVTTRTRRRHVIVVVIVIIVVQKTGACVKICSRQYKPCECLGFGHQIYNLQTSIYMCNAS